MADKPKTPRKPPLRTYYVEFTGIITGGHHVNARSKKEAQEILLRDGLGVCPDSIEEIEVTGTGEVDYA
jgi:hypothetical protein